MLNLMWLVAALAWAGGCTTVTPGIDAGATNSPMDPNGTKFSRFWKRQGDKLAAFNKKATSPANANIAQPEAEFYVTLAVAQEQGGNLDKAAEFYQKALERTPNSLPTLSSYAHFEDRRGHLVAATRLYKKALAKHPEEAGLQNDLGLCYQRRAMLEESATTLAKAVKLQPDRPLYRNNLATVLVDAGHNEDALAQLAAVNPPAVAQYNLGCLLARKGDNSLAAACFQQALIDDPTMQAAQQWLAKLGSQSTPAAAEAQLAENRRPLPPVEVETGELAGPPTVQIEERAPQVAAAPSAEVHVATPATTNQTTRQRPVGSPIDEIPPQQQSALPLPAYPANYNPAAPAAAPVMEPLPVDPAAVAPQAVSPQAVTPQAVAPQAVSPQAVTPQAVAPQAAPVGGYSANAGQIHFPSGSTPATAPEAVEASPTAPLPELIRYPSRPVSLPNQIEPLPASDPAG